MLHAARSPGQAGPPLEHQHVPSSRRLGLNEIAVLIDGNDAEDGLIKAKRSFRVANGERDVREAVRF
jgi:hypothetical protein